MHKEVIQAAAIQHLYSHFIFSLLRSVAVQKGRIEIILSHGVTRKAVKLSD